MIFANYPGHLIAALLLVISAGLTLFTFHTGELRKAKLQAYRLPLILLQYLSIAIILFILWDPSRSQESETLAKNSVLTFFDTSESMSAAEDGPSNRLDKALNLFDTKFKSFDPEIEVPSTDRIYSLYISVNLGSSGWTTHAIVVGSSPAETRSYWSVSCPPEE